MTADLDLLKRKAVAQRLKNLMDSKSISTKALAEAVGVTPGAVSQWRTGTSRMSQDSLEQVAAYLGTSASYLSTGYVDEGVDLFPLSVLETSLIRALRENYPQDTYTQEEKALIDAARDCHSLSTAQLVQIVHWLSNADLKDLTDALSAIKSVQPVMLTVEQ